MARRKNDNGPSPWDEQQRLLERRIRRRRALFIPSFLREAATSQHLKGAEQDKAHAIAIRWTDLESAGHLPQYKETSRVGQVGAVLEGQESDLTEFSVVLRGSEERRTECRRGAWLQRQFVQARSRNRPTPA